MSNFYYNSFKTDTSFIMYVTSDALSTSKKLSLLNNIRIRLYCRMYMVLRTRSCSSLPSLRDRCTGIFKATRS